MSTLSIESLPFFRGLSVRACRALAEKVSERRFAADEVLFTAGSAPRGFYVVLEGEVRVLRGARGRQHVVHVEGPGGTLGEVSLFDARGYPATAIASLPTRCAVFTREAIGAAIAEDPAVAWVFLERLASRVRHLVERLDRLAVHTVRARLAAFLLARRAESAETVFELGRTQTAIAEELGTVREVVVRGLRSLRSRNIIRWEGRGRYAITDETALRSIAEE
ncbi:MAG: Crp/Fnr family transcriptional regulator [Gemmatimonadota bacterium]